MLKIHLKISIETLYGLEYICAGLYHSERNIPELLNNSHYIDISRQLKHHTFTITVVNASVSLVCCSHNLEILRNRSVALLGSIVETWKVDRMSEACWTTLRFRVLIKMLPCEQLGKHLQMLKVVSSALLSRRSHSSRCLSSQSSVSSPIPFPRR